MNNDTDKAINKPRVKLCIEHRKYLNFSFNLLYRLFQFTLINLLLIVMSIFIHAYFSEMTCPKGEWYQEGGGGCFVEQPILDLLQLVICALGLIISLIFIILKPLRKLDVERRKQAEE